MVAQHLEKVGDFAVYFVRGTDYVAGVVQRDDHRSGEKVHQVSEIQWKIFVEVSEPGELAAEIIEGNLFITAHLITAHLFVNLYNRRSDVVSSGKNSKQYTHTKGLFFHVPAP